MMVEHAVSQCSTGNVETNCTGGTLVCDTAANGGAGRCVATNTSCAFDVECVGLIDASGALTICNHSSNTCERPPCTATNIADVCVTGSKIVCDTSVGSCDVVKTDCTTHSDCAHFVDSSGGLTFCNLGNTTCERPACTIDADCTDATLPYCNTSTQTCVASVDCSGDNANCVHITDNTGKALPICSGSNACVACSDEPALCTSATPLCNTTTQACVASFDCAGDNANCVNIIDGTGKPLLNCNASAECVACSDDPSVCTGGTPQCSTSTQACVAPVDCTSDANCANLTDNTGSPLNWCNTTSSTCEAYGVCTSNSDCGGNTPVCNTASGTCEACVDDAGCT
eukprot:CAMPEP_0115010834 /NCGR_PEP_ID=MMETSP0216-20121206/23577_1 /TAXON_ID=223996 /ORGANISM="Protocruzia adherens, Strain Boccale" /LENGTH=341 /DNA_ID=CAMNT_0002379175 /DNA_START=53 /DNA_END=1075 /DNA_ORIENTATION=+